MILEKRLLKLHNNFELRNYVDLIKIDIFLYQIRAIRFLVREKIKEIKIVIIFFVKNQLMLLNFSYFSYKKMCLLLITDTLITDKRNEIIQLA